ncbi:MAG: hypothetical protein WD002_02940 [Pseudomonadales bacterium]
MQKGFFIFVLFLIASVSANSMELKDNLEVRVPAYMPAELRSQVTDLQHAVIKSPTRTAEQIPPRARILWQWANAYSLTGRPLHPEFTSTMVRMINGPLPPRLVESYGPTLDWFIREFSFRDANPDGIGYLTSDHLGPFSANGYAELRQTYTVGSEPIRKGGGLLVATRMYGGPFVIQTEDPTGDGYLTVTTNNPEVEFEISNLMVSGMFSGQLGGTNPRPFFKVKKGTLNSGDQVSITAGDRRYGSKGVKLPSQSSSAMRVRVFISLEDENQLFSMNELPFFSQGLETANVRGFGPSVAAVGEMALLSIRSEDTFRNRATSGFRPYNIYDGDKLIHRIGDTSRPYHEFNYRFENPGTYYLTVRSNDGAFEGEFNPILVENKPAQRIYWGETHGHTGFAEGAGTVENFFRFGREDARLDFLTLSEHDIWLDDYEFEVLRKEVKEYFDSDRYLTYLGYEWTAPPENGGHHNVLFRTWEGVRRVERQRAPELTHLHQMLKEENRPADVLVIPHAHNPGRWWQSDSEVEALVEIVSNHGTFEWLGRAFLASGYHLGFIGGSDDHIGHPGLRPLSNAGSGPDNFGGMAAVLSESLDRDLVFDAMKARQTYATNGQKIILQAKTNGSEMGREIALARRVEILGRTIGTAPVTYVDLIKNGELMKRLDFMQSANRNSGLVEVRFYSESDPHERNVHSRGARPWQGNLTVEGARILAVKTPNVENVYTESARVNESDPGKVDFFMRTRGAYRSIVLQLADVTRGATISIEATTRRENVSQKIDIGRMSGDPHRISAPEDKFNDEVVVRWIKAPTKREREFRFEDTEAKSSDTWYVRVIQENGGMAWSSPVRMQ